MSASPHARPAARFDKVRPLAVIAALFTLAGCARELPFSPAADAESERLRHIPGGRLPEGGIPSVLPDDESGSVVISVLPGVSPAQVAADHGATVIHEIDVDGSTFGELMPSTGILPATLAGELALDPRVLMAEAGIYLEAAEARQESFAFDDGFGSAQSAASQPSLRALRLREAHLVSQGAGVTVAILDTGVDPGHPLLASRIRGGWDFVEGDADPTDAANLIDEDGDGLVDEARGHGTHVAGIVAMVAPAADLLIVRVLDSDGRGELSRIAAGIRWAVDHGARVINLSLGSLRGSNLIQDLLEQAEDNGVVTIAAAGNWGAEKPEEYPAESSHAIGVSAVDPDDRPATFSSYGGHIDVSAPGVNVRSAYLDGGYALWSGTSMAVPFVSGTAALLLSIHPTWTHLDIEQRMFYTARPVQANSGLAQFFGAGVIDAGAALAPDAQPSNGDAGDDGPKRISLEP